MKRILTILLAAMLILSMGIQTAFAEASLRIVAEPYDTSPYRILRFDEQGRVEMYNTADGGVYRGNIENGKFPANPEKIADSYEPGLLAPVDYDTCFTDKLGRIGYRDAKGVVLVAPGEYDKLDNWVDSCWLVVTKDGKQGLINKNTGFAIPTIYDKAEPMGSGKYIAVSQGAQHALIDASGNVVLAMQSDEYEYSIDNSMDPVFVVDRSVPGKEGLKTIDGRTVVKPVYDSCYASSCVNDDYFIVTCIGDDVLMGLVKRDGSFTINPSDINIDESGKYLEISSYEDDTCYVLDEDTMTRMFPGNREVHIWGDMDNVFFALYKNDGVTVIDEDGNALFSFSDSDEIAEGWNFRYIGSGYFSASLDRKLVIINSSGKIVSRTEFRSHFNGLRDGRYLSVYDGSKYGIYDIKSNKTVLPCEYKSIEKISTENDIDYSETMFGSVCRANDGNGYGIVGFDGRVIVPFEYSRIELKSFGGYFVYAKNGKRGLYAADGSLLFNTEYYWFGGFDDDKYIIFSKQEDGKDYFGISDLKGNVLLPCEYDEIAETDGGFYLVKKDGKWGILDSAFNTKIPAKYDYIIITNGHYFITETINGEHSDYGLIMLSDSPFNDVVPGSYYEDAVKWAKDNGVTSGTSPDTFSPEKKCNRAQVVTFLWNAAGQPEPETADNPFADVKTTDWYYKSVLWAVEQGITSGTSATTFSPLKDCTNAHVLTFLWNFMGQPETEGDGNWYSYAMNWAEANGLNAGIAGADVALGVCPRKDIVTFMYRYFTGE